MDLKDILAWFKSYSTDKWTEWIDDILFFEEAFPPYDMSSDQDPLIDISLFLARNNVSSLKYEKALVDRFLKYVTVHPGSPQLPRLLNAVITGRPSRTEEVLTQIFLDREIDQVRLPDGALLKGQILLGLSKVLPEKEELAAILAYCKTIGPGLIATDAAFMTNYLRVVIRHDGFAAYFAELTFVLGKLRLPAEGLDGKEQYLVTLVDNLEEVFYYHNGGFYRAFYSWLVGWFPQLEALAGFDWLIKVLAEKLDYMFNSGTPELRNRPDREYVLALRRFIMLWSCAETPLELNAIFLHRVAAFFTQHEGTDVIRKVLQKNRSHIYGKIFIGGGALSDTQNNIEFVTDEDAYIMLGEVMSSFSSTRDIAKAGYRVAMDDPEARRRIKKEMDLTHADSYNQLKETLSRI